MFNLVEIQIIVLFKMCCYSKTAEYLNSVKDILSISCLHLCNITLYLHFLDKTFSNINYIQSIGVFWYFPSQSTLFSHVWKDLSVLNAVPLMRLERRTFLFQVKYSTTTCSSYSIKTFLDFITFYIIKHDFSWIRNCLSVIQNVFCQFQIHLIHNCRTNLKHWTPDMLLCKMISASTLI